jgi:hypothetical protein
MPVRASEERIRIGVAISAETSGQPYRYPAMIPAVRRRAV